MKRFSTFTILLILAFLTGCQTPNEMLNKGPAYIKEYDDKILLDISKRWYLFLAPYDMKGVLKGGKIVLQFEEEQNGNVKDIKVLKNTVGKLWAPVCIKAIKDSAPFESWTPEMKRRIKNPTRTITFTFHFLP